MTHSSISHWFDPFIQNGLRPIKTLGVGGTCEVILVEREDGSRYALKRILTPFRVHRASRDLLLYEGVHLSLVKSPRIISCYQVIRSVLPEAHLLKQFHQNPLQNPQSRSERYDEVILLLEYIEGITLRSLLIQCRSHQPPLQREEVASFIWDIVNGLRALQDAKKSDGRPCPIVHGDLNPSNVMVRPNGASTLIDLSAASSPLINQSKIHRRGPFKYRCPQDPGDLDGEVDDFYSLGCLWFELVTGSLPPKEAVISSQELRAAGWPRDWSLSVTGLLSKNGARRRECFRSLDRDVIWGGDRSQHAQKKTIARRTLAQRVKLTPVL